jgi:hypothetical protein
MMFKRLFKGVFIYILFLVFVFPVIIFALIGNASRKQDDNNKPTNTPPDILTQQNVPLPTKEDTVRTFCNLIDEGRVSDAITLMDINDETVRQSWGVYLNNFSSFKLVNIGKSKIDETGNSFEVEINVTLKKNMSDLPISNYGWVNGVNKRWFNLVKKENGLYRISEIATGP